MMRARIAGIVYAIVSAVVVAFQVALAAGTPWGEYAMGGAFPGRFPPALRIAALVQGAILTLMAGVVLSRAGIALPRWSRVSRRIVWVVVVVSALGFATNVMTPSKRERTILAPAAFLMVACSAIVAMANRPQSPGR